jgi:hypothetical protein
MFSVEQVYYLDLIPQFAGATIVIPSAVMFLSLSHGWPIWAPLHICNTQPIEVTNVLVYVCITVGEWWIWSISNSILEIQTVIVVVEAFICGFTICYMFLMQVAKCDFVIEMW